MPDSLAKRAYRATSFFSISKGIAAVGLSALTLFWNWMFGLRNWDTTKTFLLCLPLAYASVALLAFVWNLSLMSARDWWTSFVSGLRMDVLNVIRDAATPTIPTQTQHLRRTEFDPSILSKLREFLSQKPKGSVRIVGEEGDPGAYSLSQHLADAFKQSGWNVAQGSLDLHFSSGAVFVLDHANEVSKYSNLIREALVASGIAFQRFSMNGTEFTTCTIYVTAQES